MVPILVSRCVWLLHMLVFIFDRPVYQSMRTESQHIIDVWLDLNQRGWYEILID
jgi:hypothetical protein